MSTIPAGWYPDPSDPRQERLWDGEQWTEQTRQARNPDAVKEATGPWAPPQPASATPPSPVRSLQDLLADAPTSGPTPIPIPIPIPTPIPTPRRRRHMWLGLAIVAVVVATGAVFVVRADQFRRQTETRDMIELIEESEAIMLAWIDDAIEANKWLEAECASSEERCAAAWADEGFQEALAGRAREAATSLKAIANEFTSERGLRIWTWHGDVVLARDSYLDHNAAWVRSLEAKGRNPEEYFTDTVNDDDIGPTFTLACRNLRRIKDSSMYPNLSAKNKQRIDKICAE